MGGGSLICDNTVLWVHYDEKALTDYKFFCFDGIPQFMYVSKDEYDIIIVGAGLYGAVCARELSNAGKTVSVIDKRDHIAGNVYTYKCEGINVHQYGAHIFHTNNTTVWDYVQRFATFNRFTNSPVANSKQT